MYLLRHILRHSGVVGFAGFVLGIALLACFSPTIRDHGVSPNASLRFSDMAGRMVGLELPPAKLVVFPPLHFDIAAMDGSMHRFVALPDYVISRTRAGPFRRIFPELETLPSTGKLPFPDIEWVLRHRPDAILAWTTNSDILDKIGFPGVVKIGFAWPHYREARREMWRLAASLLNAEDRAFAYLKRTECVLEELRRSLAKATSRTRVGMPFIRSEGDWAMGSMNYYLNDVISAAGGINIAEDKPFAANLGLEQIIKFDPEVILLSMNEAQMTAPEALYAAPAWRSIRAVRDRRVYVMPTHFLNNIALDEPLLTIWLSEILQPDLLPPSTRDAYRTFYQDVYAYSLADHEIDQALFIKENRRSRGYERFLGQSGKEGQSAHVAPVGPLREPPEGLKNCPLNSYPPAKKN